MICGTPGYTPSPEEREEVVQLVMSIHAWMLGLPDPRERISLPDAQHQPQDAQRAAVTSPPRDSTAAR